MAKTAKKATPKKAAKKSAPAKKSAKPEKKATRQVAKAAVLAAGYDGKSTVAGDPYAHAAALIDPKQIGLATMPTQAKTELPPFDNPPPKRRRDLMGDDPPPAPTPETETFDGAFLRAVMDQLKFLGDKNVSTLEEARARGFDIDALNVAFAFYKLSKGGRKIAAGYIMALL